MSNQPQPPLRPLRLLSLDGGGIRGYVELLILHEIMWRIQFRRNLPELPKPHEYFDLIGGTSTGGIIAVCLARLKLSTEKCLDIYKDMSKQIFENERWSLGGLLRSKFDPEILIGVIKKVLKETEYVKSNEDAPMLEPPQGPEDPNVPHRICRALVTATPGSDPKLNEPRLLRSYVTRDVATSSQPTQTSCKIWEAVRATSAAPSFFDPIEINGEKYVDGGFGCNNPSEKIYEEGLTLLGNDQSIGCLVSIGTGLPAVMPMPDRTSFLDFLKLQDMIEPMLRVATDCDQVHQRMLKKSREGHLQGKYFRFNVQQGTQGISLWMWEKLPEVKAHTKSYIDREANKCINELVDLLLADQPLFSH